MSTTNGEIFTQHRPNGLATNAVNLQVGPNYRTGDVNATNNTVAVRDSSGNFSPEYCPNGISSRRPNMLTWQKCTTQISYSNCWYMYGNRWRQRSYSN